MTLGSAAAAGVRLIVWCKACPSIKVEPDPSRWPNDTVLRPRCGIGERE
jgi:hypothetical protein